MLSKRVLIIAAHPDDDILGCGGFIAKYQPLGVQFRVVFIGEGSSCRFKDLDDQGVNSAILMRNSFAKKALNLLGIVDYEFNNLPCGRFDQIPLLEINKLIERNINLFQPDTIFTHSSDDANMDHKIVFSSTLIATRPGALFLVPRLMTYEVLSSTEWAFNKTFQPNFYEALDETSLQKKCEALMCYESEVRPFPFSRSEEGIKTLARYRGMQSGNLYAEAFSLIREFVK